MLVRTGTHYQGSGTRGQEVLEGVWDWLPSRDIGETLSVSVLFLTSDAAHYSILLIYLLVT